jgi:tetratricopeptide (TPR) repeat protein
MLLAGIWLVMAGTSRALDTVRTTTQTTPIRGEIQKVSPREVELKQGVFTKKIPVNEIVSISYDDGPALLKSALTALGNERYEQALNSLGKIKLEDVRRREIQQDIQFYRALCAARIALNSGQNIAATAKQMADFLNEQPGTYHWWQAHEVLGDLYLAAGDDNQAEQRYAELAQAPWKEYRLRAGVAIGRARLAQAKPAEAQRAFDGVLAIEAPDEVAKPYRLSAMLGKAQCLAEQGDDHQAVEAVEAVLAQADPEQIDLYARAYNTLGSALRKTGRTKDALMAFLHVDLLYFTVPEAHAEALANLAELWDELHEPQRADRARQMLKERYGNSRWAK